MDRDPRVKGRGRRLSGAGGAEPLTGLVPQE